MVSHQEQRDTVMFGTTEISYQIVRSGRRKKTLTMSLDADGLCVHAPLSMPNDDVKTFVQKRGAWIISKQAFVQDLTLTEPQRQLVNGETLRYLGRQYRLKLVAGLDEVQLSGRFLEVPKGDRKKVYTALKDWYEDQAKQLLPKRVSMYSRRISVKPQDVLIRDQQKRWGSCNRKGEVRFNWRIVMAPLSLIDYVVVHELVHLEYMNHSSAYWARLRQLLPNYQALQERLNKNGGLYTL